jgi:hypothetical protein
MVSFPALPGRYQVMTPRCWPWTCWKATGTSPVNAVAPSDGRILRRPDSFIHAALPFAGLVDALPFLACFRAMRRHGARGGGCVPERWRA